MTIIKRQNLAEVWWKYIIPEEASVYLHVYIYLYSEKQRIMYIVHVYENELLNM